VARAAQAANAGRDEKPADGAALAADEPMPEWERELLQPAGAATAAAPSADAPSTETPGTDAPASS
jgi:small subunit ribosomal protein S2